MIKADFHTHTCFSNDSKASVESMIDKAIELGLEMICFTDHFDIDYKNDIPICRLNIKEYISNLNELKSKYSKKIDIGIGIELGLESDLKNNISNILKNYNFDFIIGSTHKVGGKDPCYESICDDCSDFEMFNKYFKFELENVKSIKNYNVLGHIDYICRYRKNKNKEFKFEDYEEIIDDIFRVLIEDRKGIEINTASLRKNLSYVHPHKDIFKRYKELGGEIVTIGSDAHKPEDIGYKFNIAEELLREVGFKYYSVYKNQKVEFINL